MVRRIKTMTKEAIEKRWNKIIARLRELGISIPQEGSYGFGIYDRIVKFQLVDGVAHWTVTFSIKWEKKPSLYFERGEDIIPKRVKKWELLYESISVKLFLEIMEKIMKKGFPVDFFIDMRELEKLKVELEKVTQKIEALESDRAVTLSRIEKLEKRNAEWL